MPRETNPQDEDNDLVRKSSRGKTAKPGQRKTIHVLDGSNLYILNNQRKMNTEEESGDTIASGKYDMKYLIY